MRERGRGRRVGQVVGRHVDRLHRGDRALVGGGDALLQRAHVGGERRLITHRRGNAAEQRRHFRAGLGEAEDVVDEEQHVLALIAEVLGDGQAGEADAGAGARRLVHLAEHQRAFRLRSDPRLRVGIDLGFDELVIEVVAFAGALADAGEHRITTMGLGDVVDQFLNQHGLADAGAAEQADLAALGVRREQIDDLDAGDENFGFRRLVGVGRRFLVDRAHVFGVDRTRFIDRLADHVHDAAERAGADRHLDRAPVSVTSWPRTRPSVVSIAMVRTVDSPRCWATSSTRRLPPFLVSMRVQNGRQMAFELHVDDGADDLGNTSDLVGWCSHELSPSNSDLELPLRPSDRLGAGDDLDQLLGNHGLTRTVVDQGLLADHSPALRVALSIALICAP